MDLLWIIYRCVFLTLKVEGAVQHVLAYFHGDHTPLAPRLMTYLNDEGGKGKKQHPHEYRTQTHTYKQIEEVSTRDNILKIHYENPGSLLTSVVKT